jgi:hypothetical protein
MREKIILAIAILAGFGIACKKSGADANAQPAFRDEILGHWLVVSNNSLHDDNGIVVEWGGYYVRSVTIRKDSTFAMNGDAGSSGTWKLNGTEDKIVFYTWANATRSVIGDTTEFKISIDTNQELILEKDSALIRHRRIK